VAGRPNPQRRFTKNTRPGVADRHSTGRSGSAVRPKNFAGAFSSAWAFDEHLLYALPHQLTENKLVSIRARPLRAEGALVFERLGTLVGVILSVVPFLWAEGEDV